MKASKSDPIPRLSIKKGDSLKTIYAKARKAFTAADLAKYAQDEPMVPFERIIAEAEAVQREASQKRKSKKRVRKKTARKG